MAGGAVRRDRTPSRATSRATARSSVLFPAPFGPITVSHSPSPTSRRRRRRLGVPPSVTDTSCSASAVTPYPRLVRSTTAKNGAPKNAVTTPIGSSAGDITVRAITSA